MNHKRLASQLILDEGTKLFPYRCTAGKLTIGHGRNLEDRGITHSEALYLLTNDIQETWYDLQRALPWIDDQPEEVQEVLANMAFNLGVEGLLEFRKTLGHIQAERYKEAAREMLNSRWASQVGSRAKRLAEVVRRQ